MPSALRSWVKCSISPNRAWCRYLPHRLPRRVAKVRLPPARVRSRKNRVRTVRPRGGSRRSRGTTATPTVSGPAQEPRPGWQERINAALREAAGLSGLSEEGKRPEELNATNDD